MKQSIQSLAGLVLAVFLLCIGCGGGQSPVTPPDTNPETADNQTEEEDSLDTESGSDLQQDELVFGPKLGASTVNYLKMNTYGAQASGDTGIVYQWTMSGDYGEFTNLEKPYTMFKLHSWVPTGEKFSFKLGARSDNFDWIYLEFEVEVVKPIYTQGCTCGKILGPGSIEEYGSAFFSVNASYYTNDPDHNPLDDPPITYRWSIDPPDAGYFDDAASDTPTLIIDQTSPGLVNHISNYDIHYPHGQDVTQHENPFMTHDITATVSVEVTCEGYPTNFKDMNVRLINEGPVVSWLAPQMFGLDAPYTIHSGEEAGFSVRVENLPGPLAEGYSRIEWSIDPPHAGTFAFVYDGDFKFVFQKASQRTSVGFKASMLKEDTPARIAVYYVLENKPDLIEDDEYYLLDSMGILILSDVAAPSNLPIHDYLLENPIESVNLPPAPHGPNYLLPYNFLWNMGYETVYEFNPKNSLEPYKPDIIYPTVFPNIGDTRIEGPSETVMEMEGCAYFHVNDGVTWPGYSTLEEAWANCPWTITIVNNPDMWINFIWNYDKGDPPDPGSFTSLFPTFDVNGEYTWKTIEFIAPLYPATTYVRLHVNSPVGGDYEFHTAIRNLPDCEIIPYHPRVCSYHPNCETKPESPDPYDPIWDSSEPYIVIPGEIIRIFGYIDYSEKLEVNWECLDYYGDEMPVQFFGSENGHPLWMGDKYTLPTAQYSEWHHPWVELKFLKLTSFTIKVTVWSDTCGISMAEWYFSPY